MTLNNVPESKTIKLWPKRGGMSGVNYRCRMSDVGCMMYFKMSDVGCMMSDVL